MDSSLHQASPSVRFSRQEYWSGLPFPSPGALPHPGIELGSPVLQADSLLLSPPGKPLLLTKLKSVGFLFVLPDYTEYTIKRYSDDYTK